MSQFGKFIIFFPQIYSEPVPFWWIIVLSATCGCVELWSSTKLILFSLTIIPWIKIISLSENGRKCDQGSPQFGVFLLVTRMMSQSRCSAWVSEVRRKCGKSHFSHHSSLAMFTARQKGGLSRVIPFPLKKIFFFAVLAERRCFIVYL